MRAVANAEQRGKGDRSACNNPRLASDFEVLAHNRSGRQPPSFEPLFSFFVTHTTREIRE